MWTIYLLAKQPNHAHSKLINASGGTQYKKNRLELYSREPTDKATLLMLQKLTINLYFMITGTQT